MDSKDWRFSPCLADRVSYLIFFLHPDQALHTLQNVKISTSVRAVMEPFSERYGHTKPKSIQINSLDSELRNSLWNVCRQLLFRQRKNSTSWLRDSGFYGAAYLLFVDFFKVPEDSLPSSTRDFVKGQLEFFQNAEWYMVLNYLEFIARNRLEGQFRDQFIKAVNSELEEEKSAYRFVGNLLAPITNLTEINEIQRSLEQVDRFGSVSKHIEDAVKMYARKPNPDYRNTIKEAISAVEFRRTNHFRQANSYSRRSNKNCRREIHSSPRIHARRFEILRVHKRRGRHKA